MKNTILPTSRKFKDGPHFRVVVSVIECGMGKEMAYSTTIKECSLPGVRTFATAEQRASALIDEYGKRFHPKRSLASGVAR